MSGYLDIDLGGAVMEKLVVFRLFGEIRAREGQADFLAGQTLKITNDGPNDYVQTEAK